jgi:hypothetical protein
LKPIFFIVEVLLYHNIKKFSLPKRTFKKQKQKQVSGFNKFKISNVDYSKKYMKANQKSKKTNQNKRLDSIDKLTVLAEIKSILRKLKIN